MKAESIEVIIEFLNKQGIKTNYEQLERFNRVIEFEIEDTVYFIEWWVNRSYFKLKNEFSSPCLPFKYIAINPNSPTSKHSLQLCFYDKLPEGNKESIFYNPIPFGAMKIPFNKL